MSKMGIHVIEKRVGDHYEFCKLIQEGWEELESYIDKMRDLHCSYFLEVDEEHLRIHKFARHLLDGSSTTLRVTYQSFDVAQTCDL